MSPAHSTATSTASVARRRPQQARSQAKVDAVLDAADALVAEGGLEALTTAAVAERAGVAVGTLYQYFASAAAIAEALLVRHGVAFAAELAVVLEARRFRRKRDAANAALDAFIAYCRAHPPFLVLWRAQATAGLGLGGELGDAGHALVGVVVDALAAQGLADPGDVAFALEAQVQWAVALALVHLAFVRDPGGDEAVLAHLRRLFDLDVRTR